MRCFEKHEVIGEDTAQEDYDIFIKAIRSFQEKGIYVDTVFNTPIYDLHKYSDDIVSPETNDQIASIRDRIRSCGDWDISPSIASTIYLDSTVGIPRYFLPQTFINIDENPLAQDELIKYLDENKKAEDGLYYLSTLAPNLRYTLDEAIEFSRIYLFKITVSYQLYIPKNMLGFYTVYKSV